MRIKMGKIYWKADNTVDTFETLKSTLESFGIIALQQKPLGDEFGFKRVTDWKTPCRISFSIIWYTNLCAIRIGEWDGDFAEISFDSIAGSFGSFCDHDTIDFMYNGNPMFRLALKR